MIEGALNPVTPSTSTSSVSDQSSSSTGASTSEDSGSGSESADVSSAHLVQACSLDLMASCPQSSSSAGSDDTVRLRLPPGFSGEMNRLLNLNIGRGSSGKKEVVSWASVCLQMGMNAISVI